MRNNPFKDIIVLFSVVFLGTTTLWILDLLNIQKNVLLSDFTYAQYLGFLAGDLFAMPLLLVSAIGLYKLKFWGFILTQVEMGTWIYTSVASFVSVAAKGYDDLFVLVWSPLFVLLSLYVIVKTYKNRNYFN